MKKLLVLVPLIVTVALFAFTRPQKAEATIHYYEAGSWSSCVAKTPGVCGDNQGTQSATCQQRTSGGSNHDGCTSSGQVVHQDCDITCPQVNGTCGATKDTCDTGTFHDETDTTTEYKWKCDGANGGSHQHCSLPIVVLTPVDGVCGATKNTCDAGTVTNQNETDTAYTWKCEGKDDGKDQECSVNKDIPISETPTPAPQQPNVGGPGDGLSDGRSDGRSSCPECTAPPKSTGEVLGATTDFAGTGVAEDMIMNAVGAMGGISTAAGLVLSAKKKLHI
ncbi:MAG: hypothetical protein NT149_02310 [Candidatus Gottesmanbacteria bacterium]|nr:hypothetical protein [Candidatus Gottesmanbacteria bacterium]